MIDFDDMAHSIDYADPYSMLYDLYVEKHMGTIILAEYLGVSLSTLRRALKIYNIPVRRGRPEGIYTDITNKLISKKEVLKNLKVHQIVERFGLRDPCQFYNLATKHNLPFKRKGRSL